MGAEMATWFQDVDTDTVMWMIISFCIVVATGAAMIYWDHFMRAREKVLQEARIDDPRL
ncbi:hypothetical protein Alches_24890 [Alicyclobacillus hesperidum subsp. aegles]|uniref:Uncharacterized protein n=1 Tax=Alicyclobacillus hesperidum TaxID=89784 RepID=A0A1H2TQZ3_9BACL|nr:hypothetical protein [Alicyclobacillus hesperidum]GLG02448.1 hypothetical protein Alches_24890 [Alicyclobacillus hesperidum subsp. aegles]SDW46291.1 hypothetical protein SAMN04489725_10683 [Alicyclobacillus hesperidum]